MLFLSINKPIYTMKKLFLTLLAFAALAICACEDPEEQIVPEIKVSGESAQIFASGIQLDAAVEAAPQQAQTRQLQFTATDKWTAEVTDTKASSWLSVEPTSGNAGDVTMTITAQPNTTPDSRSATVTIKCGDVIKSFTVSQDGAKPTIIEVESITLDKTEIVLTEGDEFTLTATVKPDNATDKAVSWASSNNAVASVQDGKVTAIAEGSATITAKAGDKTTTCAVTVNKQYIVVESVTLSETELSLTKGATATLTATVSPSDATNPAVSWSSSDESVASVKDGVVTAIKSGTATITATAENATASCAVTVTNPAISLTLDNHELTLTEGESATLVATVEPADADDLPVAWRSANPEIATVDANGKITAIAEGTATITATCGNFWANCRVTVNKLVIPVESISLDKTTLNLTEGESANLTATITPGNTTDKTVTWSTSNASVATVDQSGKVTAVAPGTATVTAKAGDKEATCQVTVAKAVIPVSSVTLDITDMKLIEGGSFKLTATVSPTDADDKTVTWTSSDTNVATVDNTGNVTAVAAGRATITATAGSVSANCFVTVEKRVIPVESITLDKTNLSLIRGEEATLTATVSPTEATNHDITWISSDESVATVAGGKVKAIKTGSAIITAKAEDKEALCLVNVTTPVESISLNQSAITLDKGQNAKLTATVNPSDADDNTVIWSSSNQAVAIVDNTGKVTAVDKGDAVITAKAGGKEATCNVTVTVSIIHVTSITLNEVAKLLAEGETFQLSATVNPDNATDKTIVWSSSNPAVATVATSDGDGGDGAVIKAGLVTAIAEGEATITATCDGKSATCKIIVSKPVIPVSSITLDKEELTLYTGESFTLTATVNPENANDNFVIWSSSNPDVATVDANGKVTAKTEGEATITAAAGGKSVTCKVTVAKSALEIIEDDGEEEDW